MQPLSLPYTGNSPIKKDKAVESLRGLAILLVVAGHVIGADAQGGLKVAPDSLYRYAYISLELIRLPLFTVISGFVYALHPVAPGQEQLFLGKKLRRLIVPMYLLGLLLFSLRVIVPSTNFSHSVHEIWRLLVFPYDLYWYLMSLFLIFIFITLADNKFQLHKPLNWGLALITAFLLFQLDNYSLQGGINPFSYKGALYLLPFFLFGAGLARFYRLLLHPATLRVAAVIMLSGLLWQQLGYFDIAPSIGRSHWYGMVTGMAATLLMFRYRVCIPFLAKIGKYAYSIFLFHIFIIATVRICMMNILGITYKPLLLVVALIMAVVISIIAENVAERHPVTRMLFLGKKPYSKKPTVPANA